MLLLPAYAQPHRSEAWARSQFAAAQRLHQSLEARPAQQLTRSDYERVINAYHLVYFEAPVSTRADPSVVAVAQLKEEMGRRFDDDDMLRSAIEQYEFLRRQYPGSKARFGALFRIGEIYKDDLQDKTRADAVFREFLQRYPRNQFAEPARKALAEPLEKASLKSAVKKPAVAASKEVDEEDQDRTTDRGDTDIDRTTTDARPGRVRVTGIRHWSTPEYTRIAVDLNGGIRFESQRIDGPDRIFFDLLNTQLDSQVGAKSYDVDDAFLKKVRISQFKPGRTRVVLEVNEVSDFQASLKSDPPRLVIEVCNKDAHSQNARNEPNRTATPEDDGDVPTDEMAGAKAPLAGATANTQSKAASGVPCRNGDSDSGNCVASGEEKPASRNVVISSAGVTKTIVEADDDDEPAANTVAKIEPSPEAKQVHRSSPPAASTEAASSRKTRRRAPVDEAVVHEAQPTASGDRSLTRALGLKIGKIVIDPGHGGHDTGTIGPKGLQEKDLVLDVSRRLGRLLTTRLGAEVVYTRSDDTFIPLETRTAIANQEGADLFVSVHANSSRDPEARGVETYYLNFTSSPDALEVAARENAVSEKSIHELQDLVKKIALKEKIEESQEFASDVESSLHDGLAVKNPGLRDRGVKKAPFIVLIGANMPSILAEISFVSNPGDERKLRTADYRQRIAEALYRGISKYVSGLSGVKVASKIEKGEGQ